MATILISLFAVIPISAPAADDQLIYVRQQGGHEREDYGLRMLALALGHAGLDLELRASEAREMTQSRAIISIQNGTADIGWFGSGAEIEAALHPIRIPLDRGLLGYRLFIIRQDRQQEFSTLVSLKKLISKRAGQGLGWADIAILNNAGFAVTAAGFEQLFKLVSLNRIDFLPLGANEIYPLLDARRDRLPDLTVEKDLCLVYPWGLFFFVRKDRNDLAEAIESGLQAALADGSFEAVFRNHAWLKAAMGKARLRERILIHIDNPLLTKATQQAFERYRYHPR